jgi:hypothetical protein
MRYQATLAAVEALHAGAIAPGRAEPWWQQRGLLVAAVVAELAIAGWFLVERRRARRRRAGARATARPDALTIGMLVDHVVALSDVVADLATRLAESEGRVRSTPAAPPSRPPVVPPALPTRGTARPRAPHDSGRPSRPAAEAMDPPFALQRLLELDRDRRRLHEWMDGKSGDAGYVLDWPTERELARFRASPPGTGG